MVNVKEQVEKLIEPIVEANGCMLVEVAYEKKFDGMHLTVYIDKKGGVTIDDCENVHRAIDEPLDELDPTNGAAYTLNVSSPGLDREIKTDKDFERNLGEELEINLYQKLLKSKKYVGTLELYDKEKITIKNQKGELIEIPRSKIAKATKYIKF